LALDLPVQDSRAEACATTLAEAIAERRTVRITMASKIRKEAAALRMDPYRLLPSPSGLELLGYCHERRRIVRVSLARLKDVSALRRRFSAGDASRAGTTPASDPGRRVGRSLDPGALSPAAGPDAQEAPAGRALMWENGPDGSVIFTLAALRLEDLLPWLLACGDAVEVLKPPELRQEILRIARALSERYASRPAPESPS